MIFWDYVWVYIIFDYSSFFIILKEEMDQPIITEEINPHNH